ncbi:hypothetical protein MNBD_ALPHA06-1481 [hydrothermal vent metagenome]|uniref:DUF481 domain-containing protein n=1 Tax=hydrothermal vent metagenome TaxID=652676 RepID=A0A3B0RRT1_9ZZZZ
MRKWILITVLTAGFTPAVMAEDTNDGWSGEASLSGSKTTGNTNTTDIGVAVHIKKVNGPWESKFDTTYDLGTANGISNKNRWTIGYQLNRQVNERMYVYGNANYFSDDFGPFKQGSFVGAGFGLDVIKTEPASWELEAGTGYRSQKSRGAGLVFPVRENEIAFRSGSRFTYKFNDAVSFFNTTELIWSDSDRYIWNDTGITAQIAGNLAARFNFRVDNHSTVAPGVKNTDTITRGALVYTLQ